MWSLDRNAKGKRVSEVDYSEKSKKKKNFQVVNKFIKVATEE